MCAIDYISKNNIHCRSWTVKFVYYINNILKNYHFCCIFYREVHVSHVRFYRRVRLYNSTGVFGVRNNKSVKNGRVYHGSSNNNNSQSDINSGSASQLDLDTYIIDDVDQKLLELLIRGYENKKIATEVKTPLSTIQRRIRKIYENQYVSRKNELNYNKLGLRKGYLQISLRGDKSYEVAQKLAGIRGVIAVSELTGNFDILCTCIFKNTDELFNLIEDIKTIERIDKVTWAEEVHSVSIEVGEKIATLGSVPE
jgi:DNA-binding Lrp family transcriptional regulator